MQIRHSLKRAAGLLVITLSACGSGEGEPPATVRGERGTSDSPASSLRTVELTVPSMSCPLCSRSIEAALEEAGLRDIAIDLQSKLVSVRFDPARTTVAGVKSVVEGQGFPVTEARVVEDPRREEGR